LIGAALRFRAAGAHLVTSSTFSTPARKAKDELQQGILEVNLVDAHELLRLFECYSDPAITLKDIEAILDRD
jgi:restriction endonuclease Mrr